MHLSHIVRGTNHGASRSAGVEAGARVMIQLGQFEIQFGFVIEPAHKTFNKDRYLVISG